MKGALFASKFRALSHVKLVDFTPSTESIAYRIAEMERLSATRCLISPGSSDDLWSTSSLARSRASSSSRSEEHTSELQSRPHLVCRLLLEKKKKKLEFYE